uniref:Protein FAM210B n=1 Tax=Bactrocera dorsalis TaxID=27457 RepID=A0A034WLY2_BACDO
MFNNTKNVLISASRIGTINPLCYRRDINDVLSLSAIKPLHTTTARPNKTLVAVLPLPNNIDPAETTRFSPNRTRDITGPVILSQQRQSVLSNIDITADNTNTATTPPNTGYGVQDPHVQSYDCFGAVSLNAVMQSNVPNPYGGMHKFSHLNMPGGQWSQEGKFMSNNLHNSHYTNLRKDVRSDWMTYDQDFDINKKATANLPTNTLSILKFTPSQTDKRYYSTTTDGDKPPAVLSKKEQLKKAFKDYGSTVIVFHVAISLASLGCCYLLVSGGIDVVPILERVGFASSALTNKITTGASTFVIAYAIHKVFAPVRISITLGATPFIVRFMRSKGYMKPPKI